jgi:magnesium-transporting ATPase (P-type)
VFCDKTGTLTKNILIFKKLSVMGQTLDIDSFINLDEFAKGLQQASQMNKPGFNE